MDFLRVLILLGLMGCGGNSTLKYIIQEGSGHLSLYNRARPNQEVLSNPLVPAINKEKIQNIEKYKNFFFSYFKQKPARIYQQTTFLNRSAVTYLVVASPLDKIEAYRHSLFPFGNYPYLGFFSKERAENYERELMEKNLSTMIRPVKAYSSLNYFEDPILSTFFEYEEEDLAELIFHELFHTLFFIRDDIDLSENLANYFGRELRKIYFPKESVSNEEDIFSSEILKAAKNLNERYKNTPQDNPQGYLMLLNQYLSEHFYPLMEKLCKAHQVEKCWPLAVSWNNARFVSFLTYEKEQDVFAIWHQKEQTDLASFFDKLRETYNGYKKNNPKESFVEYVKKNIIN